MLVRLHSLGPDIVVITNGPQGAYAFQGNKSYFLRSFPHKKIEPTGAGDSFASAFLSAIIYKLPVKEAIGWGNINAAHVINKIGSQVGLLTKPQITRLLNQHKTYKSSLIK